MRVKNNKIMGTTKQKIGSLIALVSPFWILVLTKILETDNMVLVCAWLSGVIIIAWLVANLIVPTYE